MAKIEIHVPNKSYDGYLGGVRFHNGVGVFEDVALAKQLSDQFGYQLVEIEEAPKPVKEEEKAEKPAPRKRKKAGE